MTTQELIEDRLVTLKRELQEETHRHGYHSDQAQRVRRQIREHLVAQCYLDMVPVVGGTNRIPEPEHLIGT